MSDTWFHPATPDWGQHIITILQQHTQLLRSIMAAVQVEQTDIDTLTAGLEAVKTALAAELADLEAKLAAAIAAQQPLPAGSLDGLKAALGDLTALEAPAPTPAP